MPYIKQMPSKQPMHCNILHPHLSLLCRPGEMLPPMRENLTYSTHVALKQEAKRATAQEQTGRTTTFNLSTSACTPYSLPWVAVAGAKNVIVVIRQLTIKSIVHEIPSEISCIAHNEKVGNKPTGSLFVKANMLLLLSHSPHEWPHSSQGGLGEP